VEKDVAEIQLADLCKTDEKWFPAKFRVVADLRNHAGVKTVLFIERYEDRGIQAEKAEATATVETTMPAAEADPAPEPKAPAEPAPAEPSAAEKPKSQPRRRPKKEEKAPEEL
jgi:hypothetical protein